MACICKSQALGRHGIQPSLAAHAVSSDRLRPLQQHQRASLQKTPQEAHCHAQTEHIQQLQPAICTMLEGEDSRNLGHQMHNVLVVHKEVANDAAEAQDEDGCHALKRQAQPNADHGCKATASAISLLGEGCTHSSHQLLQLPHTGPAWASPCPVWVCILDLRLLASRCSLHWKIQGTQRCRWGGQCVPCLMSWRSCGSPPPAYCQHV